MVDQEGKQQMALAAALHCYIVKSNSAEKSRNRAERRFLSFAGLRMQLRSYEFRS